LAPLFDRLDEVQEDSMGRSRIFYWTRVQVED
jgi:hypothetical protein